MGRRDNDEEELDDEADPPVGISAAAESIAAKLASKIGGQRLAAMSPTPAVEPTAAPKSVSPRGERLLADAAAHGFQHLGWLAVKMSWDLHIAVFVHDDGSTTLAITGAVRGNEFDVLATDCSSRLDRERWVTSTTMGFAGSQPERGIHKFAHRNAQLQELHRLHAGHVAELGGEVEPAPKTLEECAQSIRDFLAFEAGR